MRCPHPSSKLAEWAIRRARVLFLCGALVYGVWSVVARAQPIAAALPCIVSQKQPLFVGFSRSFEAAQPVPSVSVSRAVLKGAKQWLCSAAPLSHALSAESLRRALEQRERLRFEQVRFEDPTLSRAHVLLSDAGSNARSRHAWRLQLEQRRQAWEVTDAGDAPLRE